MSYYRYLLTTGKNMGWTETENDRPDCGYTEIAPPSRHPFKEGVRWTGTEWEILTMEEYNKI